MSTNVLRPHYRILNIGNSKPVGLMVFIEALENSLGKKAIKNLLPLQLGDVTRTWADVSRICNLVDYKPTFSVQKGVECFAKWYIEFQGKSRM